jgi:hypothetical protein
MSILADSWSSLAAIVPIEGKQYVTYGYLVVNILKCQIKWTLHHRYPIQQSTWGLPVHRPGLSGIPQRFRPADTFLTWPVAGGGTAGICWIKATAWPDTSTISERLEGRKNLTIITADLETGDDPFANEGSLGGQKFNGIIAVNYLYRPLMMALINALKPGGVLLYETFARGNEVYSRPRNPDHLLRSGELLDLAAGRLQVLAYEHGLIEADGLPCVRQRLIGVRDLALSKRDDGDPPAHQIGN